MIECKAFLAYMFHWQPSELDELTTVEFLAYFDEAKKICQHLKPK